MKDFLLRLTLAATVTLVATLASPANAQQADEDRAPAAQQQRQPSAAPQSPQQHDAQAPTSGNAQTQDALAFNGRVVKEKGQIVLNDPVTKMSYQFDDQSKAKPYIGKQVKVTGKLDLSNNTIHIDSIEPLS